MMPDKCSPLTDEKREEMIDGVASLLFGTMAEEGYSGARVKAEELLEGEFNKVNRLTRKCTAYPINGCSHPQFCKDGCAGKPHA